MHSIIMGRSGENGFDTTTSEEMFRFRHKVFFERLGWEVSSQAAMEIDSFDAADPCYMLARDEHKQVVGCWRLLPTTGPYMLKDTFPQLLCGETPPTAPQIWECSRFAVESAASGDLAQASLSPVTFAMIRAVYDFAVTRGIDEYVMVTSVALERMLKRMHIPISRFGAGHAQRVGKVLSVACRVTVNDEFRRVVYPDPGYGAHTEVAA